MHDATGDFKMIEMKGEKKKEFYTINIMKQLKSLVNSLCSQQSTIFVMARDSFVKKL